MNRARIKAIAAILAGLVALVALAGCDSNENADLANGRVLFAESCARCHYLNESGGGTNVGPDLDAAFAAARNVGMDQDTIEGVVESQIANPRTVNPSDPSYMPANLVEGDDARDVAAYVASVAGVPGIEPPISAGGPGGQVFTSAGCGTCHTFAAAESTGNVGPNLNDALTGQRPEEILQSIVEPDAKISQGFEGGIMPSDYEASIEPQELDTLVKFLADCQDVSPDDEGAPSFCVSKE